jgi:YHS domain-containing protein
MATRLTILAVLIVVAAAAGAQVMDGTEFNTNEDGLALEGYDPVAYFTLGEATEGTPEIEAQYNGVKFRFADESHRRLFEADPEKYLPAYGAYCAWAASRGNLADIDPTAFVVHDDRLFLNYNNRLNRRFIGDLDENVEKADQNWPGLSEEAAGK